MAKSLTISEATAIKELESISIVGLEVRFTEATAGLNKRQLIYIKHRCSGENRRQAYIKAGYSTKKNESSGAAILENNQAIANSIKLGRVIHQIKFGVSLEYKRDKLLGLISKTSDHTSSKYNPTHAISALKLLADIDGNTMQDAKQAGGPVNIVINTGMPERITTTVNAESTEISNSKPKAIEE